MNTENTIAKSAPRRKVAISKGIFLETQVAVANSRPKVTAVAKVEAAAVAAPDRDRRDRRERRDNRAPNAPALRAEYAVFQDVQRHTCIRIGLDQHHVQFIPMAAVLEVVELSHYEFEKQYTQLEDYPVKQAARMYLEATHLERSPIAKKHLDYLCGNSFVDPVQITNFNEKESVMTPAAQKAAAAKKGAPKAPPAKVATAKPPVAARGKTDGAHVPDPKLVEALSKAKKAEESARAEDKGRKVAASAKFAGAPSAKKVAAPAPTLPIKAKGAVKVAPGVAQKVKVVAPNAKKDTVRATDATKYTLVDSDKPRKGATADACAIAKKLGTSFTRPQLQVALEKAGWDAKVAKIKIADCVYFKVFAEAK